MSSKGFCSCSLSFTFLAGSVKLCGDCKTLALPLDDENGLWLLLKGRFDLECCFRRLLWFLRFTYLFRIAAMLGSISRGNNWQRNVECVGS